MSNNVGHALRERIKSTWPSKHRNTITKVLDANDRLATKKAELNKDGDLSNDGRAKRLREFAIINIGNTLALATRSIESSQLDAQNRRAALIKKAVSADPTTAALGAEIRAALRGMDQGSQVAFLAGQQADTRVQVAVLSAPLFLSGVSKDFRDLAEADYLERNHGQEIATLNESGEALEMVATASRVLRESMVSAVGMTPSAFQSWFGKEFAPTPSDLRAEDSAAAQHDLSDVEQTAAQLPLSERIALVGKLMDRNTKEILA